MRKIHYLRLFLLLNISLYAQYTPISPYLANPGLTIGYVDSCAQFWMNTLDSERGGYYTNIDRYGNVITAWGTNKNLLTQSRNAYGFTRAFMMTGNDIYREYAEAGLDFMYEHAWDSVNGGWYAQLDINGNALGATDGRSAFDAHYALLGPATAYEAFGDSVDLKMLMKGYDHLEDVYWDKRVGLEGYYDWATYTGNASYDKSFNATVDAITTHLLSLYLQTLDQTYLDRMHQISQQIIDHLVASMPNQAIGFVEEYDSDWNWDNGSTMTIMGHVLKSAWCLVRVYHLDPKPEYLEAAELLVKDVLDHGYDHEFGGPYKDYNRSTGAMLMWGNPDTAKAWWQMEQAITAGLQLWSVTGNEIYIKMADETLDFFMKHFVDHTYGDVYENRTRYGNETWGLNKGGGGKAAYHSIETGYYTYLYSSIFFHKQAFSLYYWFDPEPQDRSILVLPLYSVVDGIEIGSVSLDNEIYTNYESSAPKLIIPANVGGKFKVTFIPASPSYTHTEIQPGMFELSHAFPNPFNSQTSITFELNESGMVDVSVFDIQGREIRSLLSGIESSGKYKLSWDGTDDNGRELVTGVYLIRSKVGPHTISQKVLLLK